jgi:hypothetical protein
VSVAAFAVEPTNEGILEGGLTRDLNARQREWLLASAKKRFGEPLVVIEPTIEPLPQVSRWPIDQIPARFVRERPEPDRRAFRACCRRCADGSPRYDSEPW